MNIPERLTKLRTQMAEKEIDIYVVPTADFHQSEYVGEHFKARKYITGFTGSAGTAVITMDEAGLWTDGRYFLQAERQLEGSTIQLFKMGEPDVPKVVEYIADKLPEQGTLGFDGRVVSMKDGQSYEAVLSRKQASVCYDSDLINAIWEDRPPLSTEPAFSLDIKYTGETTASKLERLRTAMKEAGANAHIITTLDDIAWLMNIRGNDIEFFPLILSYAVVTLERVDLYIDASKLSSEIQDALAKDGVLLHPYNDIYEAVKDFTAADTVLIDPARMNYALYNNLAADVKKVEAMNPTVPFKAMKNPVELENIRRAHIKDGVAHTKFMYWLKNTLGKETITEMSASDRLEDFRAQQEGFIRPSFGPICALGEHAANAHYSSTPETNVELTEGTLFLTDTGGGYYEGSTDITRTVALGEIPQIMKDHFTTVVQSNLHLTNAVFQYGCLGQNLDILARTPFWKQHLDYNHGTGHGVGYLMNIHEGPADIRWQYRTNDANKLEEGMVLTNEPGIYIAGSHGVRLENELIVRKGEKNEYGQFMYFETITFVPFDLDALNPDMLSEEEKGWLNAYHKQVYDKISPYLSEEEAQWLSDYTKEI